MAQRQIPQEGVNGSATTGKFTVNLDTGYKFFSYLIRRTSGTILISDFILIEYLINGIGVWSLTGQELDEINKQDGLVAYDGDVLRLPLTLEGMKEQDFRESTAVNTGYPSPMTGKQVKTHALRLTMTPGLAATFDVWADVDDGTKEGPGVIRRFNRYDKGTGGANGKFQDLDYATSQYALYRRIFTKASAGTVDNQWLQFGKTTVWGPQVPTEIANRLRVDGGHIVGSYFSYVLDYTAQNGGSMGYVNSEGKMLPTKLPFLDTMPFANVSPALVTGNSGAADNTFILEAVGEID
jgi:hypothetical protein